jgi:cysteine desulfurase/selenocysteine lyase
MTYLNTANVGLGQAFQGQAALRFASAKAQGSLGESALKANSDQVLARLHRLLGAADVRFYGNTTSALLAVAHGVDWRPGDEVLVRETDFPSVVGVWGDRARRVPDTEALLSEIGPKTRLVAVSHVDWATGERVDLGLLGRRCHERGALLCVDGVQAAGAIPLDLDHVDFYAVAPFKWLLGWFGLSFLATKSPLQGPPYAGHVNHPALFVLNDTLAWLQDEVGMDRIYARVQHLGRLTADGLASRGRVVVTPPTRAGIVSFEDPDAEATVARLAAQDIHVSARRGFVRVSPHFYNEEEEVEMLLRSL